MYDFAYEPTLSIEGRYLLYKEAVVCFCEYMKIPMLEENFCMEEYFQPNNWSLNFLEDVSYTVTQYLSENLRKGGTCQLKDFEGCRKHLERLISDWIHRGFCGEDLRLRVVGDFSLRLGFKK